MASPSKKKLQRVERFSPDALREYVSTSLAGLANASNAKAMAAYMKTEQPFFGVNQPGRKPIFRELVMRFPPETNQQYRAAIMSLWSIPQRDGQYAAIHFADHFTDRHTLANLPFFKKMVQNGAWWDHVDWIATHIVGRVVKQNRPEASEVMRKWIDDDDLWVRRTAIICQVQHKEETDSKMLFEFCLMRAHEKDFFIRKAIGWALRSYAWKEPERVRAFIIKHRTKLSGLSVREGAKHLDLPEK